MAPAGTGSWTALPTTFTGSQLRSSFRRRRGARPVHLQRSILRQRRQLRLNRSDGHAAGPDSGRLGGEPRATPRYAMRQSRRQARCCCTAGARPHQRVSEARLAGASGLGLASDGGLLRLRASLVPAPPAAGGALTDGSSGSGTLSLSHRRAASADREDNHATAGEAAEELRLVRGEARDVGKRRLWPAGETARAADEQRRPADRWPAGRDPDRSGQRLERIHPGCSGDHGPGWQLDRDSSARSLADHRSFLPGLADDPASHRVRDCDHARPRSS